MLGEFGIGCNPGIQRHMKNTLFDEKMYGTIHLAVGPGFPVAGGTNESATHWDMVKDLRQNGRTTGRGGRRGAPAGRPAPDRAEGGGQAPFFFFHRGALPLSSGASRGGVEGNRGGGGTPNANSDRNRRAVERQRRRSQPH